MNNMNANAPIIIGVDHGFGNIKTANACFQTGVSSYDKEPTFKSNLLTYEGRYYVVGEERKEFSSEKASDNDNYRAWERLQRMDRTRYKSYSRAVVAALNEFFDRQGRLANDPYLETWEKEEAFLKRVLDTVERGLRSAPPRPQTVCVAPTPDNVSAKSDSANVSQTPDSAQQAVMEDTLMGFIESF